MNENLNKVFFTHPTENTEYKDILSNILFSLFNSTLHTIKVTPLHTNISMHIAYVFKPAVSVWSYIRF